MPDPHHAYLFLSDADARGWRTAWICHGARGKARSDDAIRLGPGSLYWSLNRLAEVGLIEEASKVANQGSKEKRRRYYRLTDPGRLVLQREAETLEKVVSFARAKRVV